MGAAVTTLAVIDAAARVVARRGDHAVRLAQIAREAGTDEKDSAFSVWQSVPAIVDACYARTAQTFEAALLSGETARGTGLDKLATFLVSVLQMRRERGSLLPFTAGAEAPQTQQKRQRERDMMIRGRLRRLLAGGQRDGSIAQRSIDCACELILATLQARAVTADGPDQRMHDADLVEMLLAAVAAVPPTQ